MHINICHYRDSSSIFLYFYAWKITIQILFQHTVSQSIVLNNRWLYFIHGKLPYFAFKKASPWAKTPVHFYVCRQFFNAYQNIRLSSCLCLSCLSETSEKRTLRCTYVLYMIEHKLSILAQKRSNKNLAILVAFCVVVVYSIL